MTFTEALDHVRGVLMGDVPDDDAALTRLAGATAPAWQLVFNDPRRYGVLGLARATRDVVTVRGWYEIVGGGWLYQPALADTADLLRVLAGELAAAVLDDDPCNDGVMAS